MGSAVEINNSRVVMLIEDFETNNREFKLKDFYNLNKRERFTYYFLGFCRYGGLPDFYTYITMFKDYSEGVENILKAYENDQHVFKKGD